MTKRTIRTQIPLALPRSIAYHLLLRFLKLHTPNLALHRLAMENPQQGVILRSYRDRQQDTELLAIIIHRVIVLLALPDSGR